MLKLLLYCHLSDINILIFCLFYLPTLSFETLMSQGLDMCVRIHCIYLSPFSLKKRKKNPLYLFI